MADKEATYFVIDVGRSMGEVHNGRNNTDLNLAKEYVLDILGDKVISERKTDLAGIVLARSETAGNDNGTIVFEHLRQFDDETYQRVEQEIQPSQDDNKGDILDTIRHTMKLMIDHCRDLKYIKTINVISNFDGQTRFVREEMDTTVNFLFGRDIQLNIYGMDFVNEILDAPQQTPADERTKIQAENEKVFRQLEHNLRDMQPIKNRRDSTRCTAQPFLSAYASLSEPRVKRVKQVRTFSGKMTLGSKDQLDRGRALQIEIECFPSSRKQSAIAAKLYSSSKGEDDEKVELSWVKEFTIKDESNPDGYASIDQTDREEGYLYGSEIVTLTDEDKQLFKPETQEELEIIAFAHKDQVPRWYEMAVTDFVVGVNNDKANSAMAAFATALEQEGCCVIARFVRKQNEPVRMVVLSPYVEEGGTSESVKYPYGLVLSDLPFAEDIRYYSFPNLSEPKNVKGNPISKDSKEYASKVPSDKMNELMDSYIDKLTLVDDEFYEEENADKHVDPFEIARPEDTFNPLIHRMKHVVKTCAKVPPGEEYTIPPILPILKKYSHPPQEQFKNAEPELNELKQLLDIQKVLSAKERKELEKQAQLEGGNTNSKINQELDVDALLNQNSNQEDHGIKQESTDNGDQESEPRERTENIPEAEEVKQEEDEGENTDIAVPTQVNEDNAIADLKTILQSNTKTETQKRDACKQMAAIVLDMISGGFASDDFVLDHIYTLQEQCDNEGFTDDVFNPFYENALNSAPIRLKNQIMKLVEENSNNAS